MKEEVTIDSGRRTVSDEEPNDEAEWTQERRATPRVQYVYDFAALDAVPRGQTSLAITATRLLSGPSLETGKSSTVGAVLTGRHMICTLGHQSAGTGAKAHTHPNEQFNYVLRGMMMSDIDGDRVFAPRGWILHTPGSLVHTGLACPDDDLVFLAVKDTRHGIVGPPVDGKYDGPNCFPGFGSRAHEPRVSTAYVIEESRRLPPGPGKRYVYDMNKGADERSASSSATVTPENALGLPLGISGKMLSGERLHIAVLRFLAGARLSNYRRDNEQFAFVIDGALEADLDGEEVAVGRHCLLHLPPATRHTLSAPTGALIVLAQDKHEPGPDGEASC
jgi:quercetin dioxygenase-like cupin family protein